jgi:hypothetical protein
MSKGAHDVFIVVDNFLSSKWEAKLLTFYSASGRPSTLVLDYLKCLTLTLVIQLWLQRSLLILKMRVLTYIGMLSCEHE